MAVAVEGRITELALEAGAKIMEVFHSGDFDTASKADQSPVTAADLAADKVIGAGLADAFADIHAVTEESAESHAAKGLERFFLVDPLDGTKEFVNRRTDFTVNIALIEGGVPVAGVVYAPARERLWATRGDMAVELTVAGHRVQAGSARRIQVSAPDNSALTVVASKSHRDQATDDYIAQYKVGDFASAGSSLKFCLVAGGEADFYPRLGRTMEWDTAAGHAVLRAAGGEVRRFDDHKPLVYGKPGYENPFFLALSPGVALTPVS
ncbi:MAG: 3'(2'),5'-bisphosphate nucleotidase CysQ [Pseudomonadota bacterium]